jgi:hypothetical protein
MPPRQSPRPFPGYRGSRNATIAERRTRVLHDEMRRALLLTNANYRITSERDTDPADTRIVTVAGWTGEVVTCVQSRAEASSGGDV